VFQNRHKTIYLTLFARLVSQINQGDSFKLSFLHTVTDGIATTDEASLQHSSSEQNQKIVW